MKEMPWLDGAQADPNIFACEVSIRLPFNVLLVTKEGQLVLKMEIGHGANADLDDRVCSYDRNQIKETEHSARI